MSVLEDKKNYQSKHVPFVPTRVMLIMRKKKKDHEDFSKRTEKEYLDQFLF